MIKHYIVTWFEIERKRALDMIADMSKELKTYAKSEKANVVAVRKREEKIRELAQFVDSTTRLVDAISKTYMESMREQYRRGMKAAKQTEIFYDKHGCDKEFVRMMSINYSNQVDNI